MGDSNRKDDRALLRALYEHAPFGIGVVGRDRRILYSNPKLVQMVGYSHQELANTTIEQITHPDDRAENLELFAQLVRGERKQYQLLKRQVHRDGRVIWVRVTCSVIGHADGLMVSVIEDLGELQAARDGSTEAQFLLGERIKELTALHTTARLLAQPHRTVDDLLQQLAALLPPAFQFPEVATAEITLGDRRFTSAGDRPSATELTTRFTLDGGQVGAITVRYHEPRLRPGQAPFLPEEKPLLDSLAEMVRVELNRRAAEEAGHRLAQRIQKVASIAAMGAWEWNVDTDETVISGQLAQMLGAEGEIRGALQSNASRFVHPDDEEGLFQRVRTYVASEPREPLVVDFRAVKPGGGWQRICAIARLVKEAGASTRLIALLTDVSSRREVESKLRQAQKMEALGHVAVSVGRDFAEVLDQMKKGVATLLEELTTAEHQQLAAELAAEADRGLALNRQLLDFGGSAAAQVNVDVSDLVSKMRPMLERLAQGKAQLLTELAGDCIARGDPTQLEQVVLNLVVNARDAIADRGTVRVSTRRVDLPAADASQRFVQLSVTDTGSGMSAEAKARVFEPFFTTKPEGKGTGLGLSVVFGVVKRCGGQVTVESELGKGTTFNLFLPVAA